MKPDAWRLVEPLPITFSIPVVPERLNVLLRRHWSLRTRETERLATALMAWGIRAKPPAGRCVVALDFWTPRTPADPDARAKPMLDALVARGILPDDSPRTIVELRLASHRGPVNTLVRIWPLSDFPEIYRAPEPPPLVPPLRPAGKATGSAARRPRSPLPRS